MLIEPLPGTNRTTAISKLQKIWRKVKQPAVKWSKMLIHLYEIKAIEIETRHVGLEAHSQLVNRQAGVKVRD